MSVAMAGPTSPQLTFVLLLTLLGAPQSPGKFLLTPDITELCPFSTFCTHTSNQSIPDPTLQSCCLPCSCDVGCGSVNKCCPDVPNPTVPSMVYPCRDVTDIISSYLNNSNWRGKSSHTYTIVDGCPEETFISPEMNDSVSRCYKAKEVQDLVFVTGSLSGRTYLNKQCAYCNLESEYKEWGMYVVDKNFLKPVASFEERDRRIFETGGISLIPPSSEIALAAMCSINSIKTCNITGEWNYYDEEIERKCNDVTMDYYIEGWGILRSYANVYCFLCNRPKGIKVPSMCSPIFIDTLVSKAYSTSFSALITSSPPLMTDTSTECKTGEILDPFRMTCTELLCPIGCFAQNGNCVPFVGDPVGLQVGLLMLVKFDTALNTSNNGLVEVILRDLRQLVMRHVNRGTIRCGLCMSILVFNTPSGNMYVNMPLYSTHQCIVTDLLTGLFRLFTSTTVQATLPRTKLPVTLINLKDDSSMETQSDNIYVGNQVCHQMVVDFWTEDTIHCPSILLHRNQSMFVENERVGSRIMSSAVDVGNQTVRVCVSKYLAVYKNLRGSSSTMGQSGLVVTMIMSVYLPLSKS